MTDLLTSAVRDMRADQKQAEKSRNSFDLKKKERLEKIVDDLIGKTEEPKQDLFS